MERFDTAGETRGHERRLQDLRGEDRPIWNRLRRGDGSEGAWLIVARSPNMAIGTKTLPYTQGTALQSFTPQVGAGLPRLATHVCINQSFDRQPNRVAVAIRKYAEARVGEGQSLVVERLLQQVERWIVPSVARLHIYIYILYRDVSEARLGHVENTVHLEALVWVQYILFPVTVDDGG